jgi:hypothetical protein
VDAGRNPAGAAPVEPLLVEGVVAVDSQRRQGTRREPMDEHREEGDLAAPVRLQ